MRSLACAFCLFSLVALACGGMPLPSSGQDIATAVEQTLDAYTLEAGATQVAQTLAAAVTQLAALSETPLPPSPAEPAATAPTTTATPPSPVPPTATVEQTAPDPLPATHRDVILHNGECFDFDSGQVVASSDARCDLWLVEPALMRPWGGAQISGYVTQQPPSRSYCLGARYEPGELAIQTDLYYCLITNEGHPGFIVPRDYLGGIPFSGFVFDYWVFP